MEHTDNDIANAAAPTPVLTGTDLPEASVPASAEDTPMGAFPVADQLSNKGVAPEWGADGGAETLEDMLRGPPELLEGGGGLGLGFSPLRLPEWVSHRSPSMEDAGEVGPPAALEVSPTANPRV